MRRKGGRHEHGSAPCNEPRLFGNTCRHHRDWRQPLSFILGASLVPHNNRKRVYHQAGASRPVCTYARETYVSIAVDMLHTHSFLVCPTRNIRVAVRPVSDAAAAQEIGTRAIPQSGTRYHGWCLAGVLNIFAVRNDLLEKFVRFPAASRVMVPALYVVLMVMSVAFIVMFTVPITACGTSAEVKLA